MNRMILGNIQYRGVNYGGPVSQQRPPPPRLKAFQFAALHREWWCLHMNEYFRAGR